MIEQPSKRRKMRPNNAIAVEKAAKTETINKEKLAQEKLAQEKLEQEKLAQEKLNAEKLNQEQPIAENNNKKDKKNKEKKDKSKKEKKDKSKNEKKEKSNKEKSETTASKRKSKEKEQPVTKKSKLDEKKADSPEQPIIPKLSTPVPTPYTSASDSDETDDEKRSFPKKSAPVPVKKPVISKPAPPASELSASDSNETDDEKRKPAPKKAAPKPATVAKTTTAAVSDSDSDETDNESRNPVQKKLKKQKQKRQQQQLSASDSDDTDAEIRNKSLKKATAVKATVEDSSDSESDSDSDSNSGAKYNLLKYNKSKKDKLESNRISFRSKRAYDDKLSAAENVKDRLSDLFVPEVKDDYFISDSESETDSGEDYESREYPSWQRTLSIHHNQEKDPWPKQRAFGYSDKLKLEKRIKKICRRDGISFSQAREIFSSNHRGQYLRFFQKIAKAFPDISLHKLAKTCKDMYHKKKNTGPWTEEEVKNLKELMKIYGNNIQTISEHMDRSPANISSYLLNHSGTDKQLSNKRWTKQEDELLAKEVVKYNDADKISFIALEPLFKGTRSQKQISTRYYSLRHLIQPDGTIAKRRKATPYEELKYLNKLLEQVRDNRLVEESQVNYTKDIGFVDKKFYLKKRAMIKGFEKMSIKDILKKLIEKQKQIIQSLREEKLLGSDADADSH